MSVLLLWISTYISLIMLGILNNATGRGGSVEYRARDVLILHHVPFLIWKRSILWHFLCIWLISEWTLSFTVTRFICFIFFNLWSLPWCSNFLFISSAVACPVTINEIDGYFSAGSQFRQISSEMGCILVDSQWIPNLGKSAGWISRVVSLWIKYKVTGGKGDSFREIRS